MITPNTPATRTALRFRSIALVLLVLLSLTAHAVTIGDITRTKGSESNYITGIGIVTGLNGTGDTLSASKRVVQQQINRGLLDGAFGLQEMADTQSSAIVSISCSIPATGAREGDMLDLVVSTLGDAEDLTGGRLERVILMAPHNRGLPAIEVHGTNPLIALDTDNPTVARAPESGKMLLEVKTQLLDHLGRIHLVLDRHHASYGNAHLIASSINQNYAAEENTPDIARALDAQNIVLTVPMWERENPVAFISPILRQDLPQELLIGEAMVVINRNQGVILVKGNTQVIPMAVSIKGVTIQQINPPVEPTPVTPIVRETSFQAIDPSGIGGTDLKSLVDAFGLMGIDIDQQIAVIETMHEAGMFHAKLKRVN